MADVNAPVEQAPAMAPPTRTDKQILPRIRWVPIGKINCYLDAEKSQSNPIYKIRDMDTIYIQQFWDTIVPKTTEPTQGYKCQLDEQWFNLTKDTLIDALRITPLNNNKAFSSPPTQDTLINFFNDLVQPREPKGSLWGCIFEKNSSLIRQSRCKDYYDAYLEKVAKHQRYLAGEEVSDPDSPAPKPAK
ncbi:hypothetical protein Tco_0323590 [Tanacetum coccineum]